MASSGDDYYRDILVAGFTKLTMQTLRMFVDFLDVRIPSVPTRNAKGEAGFAKPNQTQYIMAIVTKLMKSYGCAAGDASAAAAASSSSAAASSTFCASACARASFCASAASRCARAFTCDQC